MPSDRIVELLDIYPTLVDLAGLTPPADLQGRSLRPLLTNPTSDWPHAAFTQVQRGATPGYSIRTERWRYTEWDLGRQGVELYDEVADPQELENLAQAPLYADVCADLKAQLKANHPVVVKGGKADPAARKKYSD